MLLFICRTRRTWNISRSVSIHLILLFIEETGSAEKKLQPFQYISCYSLSINSKMTVYLIARFNTSHVTLYQYKACKLHIRPERFNTSHVTLYLEGEIIEEKPLTFQYISCYSLSISCPICFFRTVVSIHLMLLFIRTPA